MAAMIGVDPHKGSHTAVALDADEQPLGELRVRSSADQLERLVGWATSFGERTWAVEVPAGVGYLVAQQLVAAGERVVDVQPKLAARVRHSVASWQAGCGVAAGQRMPRSSNACRTTVAAAAP